MCAKEMPFGHSGLQAPVLEQFLKPSSSGLTSYKKKRMSETSPFNQNMIIFINL